MNAFRKKELLYIFKRATADLKPLVEELMDDTSIEYLKHLVGERGDTLSGNSIEKLRELVESGSNKVPEKLYEVVEQAEENAAATQPDDSTAFNASFSDWLNPGSRIGGGTNLDTVGDGLNNYRSAQPPKSEEFYRFLKEKYGIQNIISLNHKNHSAEAKASELSYLHIPLGSKPPSESEWQQIKSVLSRGNTLVYCTHGADRTGAIVAKWKIEEYNEPCNSAYSEALRYGFKPQSHPGYGKGPDPNKDLRGFIEYGCN